MQSKRSGVIHDKLRGLTRTKRAVSGAALMIFGAAALFGVLIGSHSLNGFTPQGMTVLTWVSVALSGLLFVHAQTMALAMLVSLVYDGVTSSAAVTSDQSRPDVAPQ